MSDADPPAEWKDWASWVLRLTLLRPLKTRGRGPESVPHAEMKLKILYDELLECLRHTNVRSGKIVHYCTGCCSNAVEASNKLTSLIITAFAQHLGDKLPSTSRWYTLECSIIYQAAMLLIGRLLKRVARETIVNRGRDESSSSSDGPVNSDEEFKKRANRKVRQASEALDSAEHAITVTTALWSTEPVDSLNEILQHGDEVGSILVDASCSGGCISQAEEELFLRGHSHPDTPFPLSALSAHFAADSEVESKLDVKRSAFRSTIATAAGIWASCWVPVSTYPIRLLNSTTRASQTSNARTNGIAFCMPPTAALTLVSVNEFARASLSKMVAPWMTSIRSCRDSGNEG